MDALVFIHALVFLLYWFTNLPFKQGLNKFLADTTGIQVDFLLIFILFSVVIFLWSLARLVWLGKTRRGLFSAFAVFYLLFFYGSFIILFIKNPVQLARLGQLVQYFRIFLDALLLFLAAWALPRFSGRLKKGWEKGLLIGLLVLFWFIPVIYPPGAVYRGNLSEKPLLVAHRGASMLAPENTLASMQRAVDIGVYGLEADIVPGYDGTLFLMHDSTLARTTNVAQVFPDRLGDSADSFTWDELAQLNAGEWFVEQDPYGMIASGLVTAEQVAGYRSESIPTLLGLLRILQNSNQIFIYDLRIPQASHPFSSIALDLCLSTIQVSGVASRTWVLASPQDISTVRALIPDAILARGLGYGESLTADSLSAAGYQLVNSEYSLSNRMIRNYREAGLWVNIWTVDEPWQYSRLWLVGTDSVTSNNIYGLMAMAKPLMALPYPLHLGMWGVIGILALVMYLRRQPV